ncbi:hypothetical protein [Marinitoga sp. 38H-ov]|uniref:hypothetical protein n=1 Tax=Marinitoga sp. 38H-ov TaxID=1755814 RepID=UPI0013ED106C|nr:hypothetical protein [Marinitoga sp. 38H-ov]KAF2955618.1 hypothetical protein AS160_00445 [Marinitoga sp. 38H-ov]
MKKNFLIIILFISVLLLGNNERLKEYIYNFNNYTINEINDLLYTFKNIDLNNDLKIIHGSLLIKKSIHEWFLPLKYYYIYSGMLEMKEVVNNDFDNLLYRYIRGKTVFDIIEYDISKEIFINDFEYIYIRVDKDFKDNFDFGEVLFKLAKVYEKKNKKRMENLLNELKNYKNSFYYGLIYDE